MSTIIYAHRGASKIAPENTIPAFDLAYEHGADGIETDVQLTKDDIPVLIHDEQVNRTTNGSGFIKDYTYKELQQLDAGSWKSPIYQDTPIPTLDDLLAWSTDKNLKLNIEVKNNIIAYANIESIIYQKLKEYKMIQKTVISSFNHDSISTIHQEDLNVDYALLTSNRPKQTLQHAIQLEAKGLHIRYRLLSNQLVANANNQGLYVAVYTVNHPISISKVLRTGCHAMFTDVPNRARRIRDINQQKGKRL